jgi:hypothetical protein
MVAFGHCSSSWGPPVSLGYNGPAGTTSRWRATDEPAPEFDEGPYRLQGCNFPTMIRRFDALLTF